MSQTPNAEPLSGDRLTPYQKKLFFFLSVATFFEGFDFLALTQILPELRAQWGLSKFDGGMLVAFINAGTVLAYLMVRKADSWGRRRVLTLTIAGYTIFTLLSGLAPNVELFAIAQMIARLFLVGEWATTMVIAAEEYPAARRGFVIGVIQGFSSLGSIVCAGVVPLLLATRSESLGALLVGAHPEYTGLGWRLVYFVGAVPLVLLAIARRNLKETKRFMQRTDETRHNIWAIWSSPYRKRLIQLTIVWLVTYLCTQNAVTFWKEFVLAERGFTKEMVGLIIPIAAVVSMPMVFSVGYLIDKLGRRMGAVVIFVLTALGVLGSYQLYGPLLLGAALTLGIFGASAVLPVLNAYTTELFPTEFRADAFAWSNNLLGRIGYVLSPIGVGLVAEATSWGTAVSSTAIFPLVALTMIWFWLPETTGRELEETSAAL
ncbi:MAG: MFS transporter [Myxococcales bacterium]|nr:MFS transporter [Myxococcales bacterium]